jgi:hypothetical protein
VGKAEGGFMLIATPVALAVLAQAGPQAPATKPPAPPTSSTAKPDCSDRTVSSTNSDGTTIIICAQRPQGYRLDPDVMEAKREMRSGGRPPRQATEAPPPDCATVGPAPCVSAGINILAAAAVAAEMAKRLATGQEIGSMFVTDPHPDEYHLYLMAKARREAAEAEKAAEARRRAAAAEQAAQTPPKRAAE